MSAQAERKIAAAGMAGAALAILAALLALAGVMLSLGARGDRITYTAASTGGPR